MKPTTHHTLAITTGRDELIDSVREWRTFSAADDWQGMIDDLERRGTGARATFTTPSGRILLIENVGRRRFRKQGGAS